MKTRTVAATQEAAQAIRAFLAIPASRFPRIIPNSDEPECRVSADDLRAIADDRFFATLAKRVILAADGFSATIVLGDTYGPWPFVRLERLEGRA